MCEPALLHAASLLLALLGMAWLALGMPEHWQQVHGSQASPPRLKRLRLQGWAALAVSLLLCLQADHPSMAALVWPLLLTASALITGMTLAWRPGWMRGLGR